jgi:hypothetical protein
MAESNKNQTAAERARLKEALGATFSTHVCASSSCPTPQERIRMGELYPVVTLAPRKRTLFYHKACGPKVG